MVSPDVAIGRVLIRAVDSAEFRRRMLSGMGAALAEEGFILTDAEMSIMRDIAESLEGLNERSAHERVMALARTYRR